MLDARVVLNTPCGTAKLHTYEGQVDHVLDVSCTLGAVLGVVPRCCAQKSAVTSTLLLLVVFLN